MKKTKQELIDIVITAVEGGVNYWAAVSHYNPDKGTARLHELDEEGYVSLKVHDLNPSVIRKGLKLALDSEHEGIRAIAIVDIHDAIEADILVQLGLFGEVVYG